MKAPILAIEGLTVCHGALTALSEIDLTVEAGEIVSLLGANGAGKSSLLGAVIGLDKVSAGTVRLSGLALNRLAPEERARLGIGYVPERRRVFAGMSVRDNLFVACPGGGERRRQRIKDIYELFPDLANCDARPAWQLSGGQQQMLALGRALMDAPRLLLLDEPSLGLSPLLVSELFARLADIARAGTAILLAEQNAAAALGISARAAILHNGRITRSGDAAKICADMDTILFGGG